MRKPLVLAVAFGVAGLVGWILSAVNAAPQLTGAASAGIPPVLVAINEFIEQRGKPAHERVREVLREDVYENPILMAVYIVLALQFFQQTLGGLAGGAIALVLGTGVSDTLKAALSVSFFVFLPFTVIAVVFIAKAASHRMKSQQLLWISLALVVSQVVDVIWAHLFANGDVQVTAGSLASYSAVTFAVLLAAAAVGVTWARRTHASYMMGRVYRHLSLADQQALTDLLEGIPETG